MINLLIWSKDRACQLELLLRSIEKHAKGIFSTSVLYTSSNSLFDKGYNQLQAKNYPVRWIREFDFEEQTRKYIGGVSSKDPICFSTDDMVFYTQCINPHIPQFDNEVFSFRLGFNTVMQDCHSGRYQRPLFNYVQNECLVSWNPNEYHPFDNYGYPLALDTHVFQAAKMQELISYFSFKNTNQLESNMQAYTIGINRMYSYETSAAVNIPTNTLSQVTRAGEVHPYSLEYLNNEFLGGKLINLENIERTSIIGAHQELPLELI